MRATGHKKVSMAAVAARAKVSQTTVSFILNGRAVEKRISDQTCERVLKVAREMQYSPPVPELYSNGTMGRTATDTRVLAFTFVNPFGQHSHEYFTEFYHQAVADAGAMGYLVHANMGTDASRLVEFSNTEPVANASGFIFPLLAMPDEALIKKMDSTKRPYVLFNRYSTPTRPSVTIDNIARGYTQAQKLLRLGHEHIAYFDATPAGITSQATNDRYEGVLKALREAGCAHRLVFFSGCSFEKNDFAEKGEELLREHPQLTAAVASSDTTATGLLEALAKHGLTTPKDFSIVSCDKGYTGLAVHVQIETVRSCMREMSSAAVKLLDAMIETRALGGDIREHFDTQIKIIGEYENGKTTGAARASGNLVFLNAVAEKRGA